jgi:hypothetical protein
LTHIGYNKHYNTDRFSMSTVDDDFVPGNRYSDSMDSVMDSGMDDRRATKDLINMKPSLNFLERYNALLGDKSYNDDEEEERFVPEPPKLNGERKHSSKQVSPTASEISMASFSSFDSTVRAPPGVTSPASSLPKNMAPARPAPPAEPKALLQKV